MTDLSASRAFREAAARSEVRRAYVVIGVIGLMVGLLLVRNSTEAIEYQIRIAGAMGIGVLFGLQLGVIAFVRWTQRHERSIPTWFSVATVVIESLIPSAMILSNIVSGALAPYVSLSSPPILVYGLLMSLTTLRLRPLLCVLAGAVSAAGYAAILAYVICILDLSKPTTGLPPAAYVSTAALLLMSGLAAAWVAREIRRHMEAALGEAETRRRMERIEQDLSVAQSIQQALLPSAAPNIPGFEIAGWNRPADQTGGDYYDWQMLPDGNWIITLADVSGHGIGPALVTAACRAYVRASGSQHGDLASLTSRINRLLADDLPDGRFVTMVSVLIDPRGGPFALLSAGHGPIVLYLSSTGVVEDIMAHNLPLAVEPDLTFGPAQTIHLARGDVLALVTDGFSEWARIEPDGRRIEFGLARLRDSLRRHALLPAAAMIEAITRDVAAFTHPAPQQDDLTMVVIRRVGER
jgi:serine phosphatase RsbU (regulator of sigma subunit)